MDTIRVSIKRLPGNRDIPLPRYMTGGASGMDICAAVDEVTILPPGGRLLVPTGIAVAVPEGYEAQIRPRSGLAVDHGVTLLNTPGTIDSDYRGEVKVILINHGEEPFTITRGCRIAQMVVSPVCRVMWTMAERLNGTERNAGGFGHTGGITL